MTTNITTNELTRVPAPAGAERIGAWCDELKATPFRYFEGKRHHVERGDRPVVVYIDGIQRCDGTVDCGVVVHELRFDDPITAAQARQIARALIAAADVVDRMTEEEES